MGFVALWPAGPSYPHSTATTFPSPPPDLASWAHAAAHSLDTRSQRDSANAQSSFPHAKLPLKRRAATPQPQDMKGVEDIDKRARSSSPYCPPRHRLPGSRGRQWDDSLRPDRFATARDRTRSPRRKEDRPTNRSSRHPKSPAPHTNSKASKYSALDQG